MIPKFRIDADLKIHKGSSIKDVTTLEGEGLFDLKTFEDTRGRGCREWGRHHFQKKNHLSHSMATSNLNKSEEFVTNTTAASKYIPRRPRISIN